MELDGLLKLHQAQMTEAQTRADIMGKVATTALTWEQVEKANLLNISLFQNIKWDAQAHSHLLRMRNEQLQQLRKKQTQAEVLATKCLAVNALLIGGGSWTGVQQGWIAFNHIRSVSIKATAEASQVPCPSGAYELNAWMHPAPLGGPPQVANRLLDNHDAGSMLGWAQRNTYYPVVGREAHAYLSSYLSTLSAAADALAVKIETQIKEANEAVNKLLDRDYDRLKKVPKEGE